MSFQMKKVELEEKLKLVESLNEDETFELMNELGIKSTSGNELSRPIEFNLMFQCDIEPEANLWDIVDQKLPREFSQISSYSGSLSKFSVCNLIGRTAHRNAVT